MLKRDWSTLNCIQKGTFGEYYAKMVFTMYGSEVYTSEIDDRGIDFVCRFNNSKFYEVQVKTVSNQNLQFIAEHKFKKSPEFLVALVRLVNEQEPELYVFCGIDWDSEEGLLKFNSYEGKKSLPSYEIRISKKRLGTLQQYSMENWYNRIIT